MAPRLQLHDRLLLITEHVYFQPPSKEKIEYPCILYSMNGAKSEHAGNELYQWHKRYQVTVIDRNPDSALPDLVMKLPLCEFDRFYPAENLNHWVFNLFF